MFRPAMNEGEGVLLVGDRDSRMDAAIHMLFVAFDLAVFWINADSEVVDKIVAKSWSPAYVPRRAARYILELHPRRYESFQIGDKVEITYA